MRLEDEGGFSFEETGDKNVARYLLMIVEFSRVESIVSVGNSGSGRCWKSSPKGS